MRYREERRQALPGELVKALVNVDARGVTLEESDGAENLVIRKGETYSVAETYWILGGVRLENGVNLLNDKYVVMVPEETELSDDQLEAIRLRAETARKKDWDPRYTMVSVGVDIPALLAEVKRLRAKLAAMKQEARLEEIA